MITGRVVTDSCVFVKLFLDEQDCQHARSFFRKLSQENTEILVPTVFVYEVCYIAQKYEVDPQFIDRLIGEYLDYNMKEINLSNQVISKAREIIEKTAHPQSGFPSFYDASYHALAILHDCDFVTADQKHYEKTKAMGNVRLLADVTPR